MPIEKPKKKPVVGEFREAFEKSGFTEEDIQKALAPMSDDELREWGIL